MTGRVRAVSVSGGKDSTATLLLALETNWLDDVRAVFADTGNEHPATLEYVERLSEYMLGEAGRGIETVRADFTEKMAAKREKLLRIAAGEPEESVYGNRQFSERWTVDKAARAAELMQPTGNVFLDLCLLKGGFPSRKRQFCTQHLKTRPLDAWVYAQIDRHNIEQWHGVRADESASRAPLPDFEWGPKISIRRPILRWGVERVFEQHRRHGIEPNPLYLQGSSRVGCMPCINSSKADIRNLALRFPEHVDKVREYERIVSGAIRNEIPATFFHVRGTGWDDRGIDGAVRWARTSRGGRQYDGLFEMQDATLCSSEYGLCE